MFRIRKATRADARAIHDLIWRVKINPLSLDWQRFLVAVDEQDRLLGCGQIKPHRDGTREMASIAVLPEQKNQGIGRAVIERLLADNKLPLYLTCRAVMETYYNKFGFHALRADEMPPYFRRIHWLVSSVNVLWPGMGDMCVMVKNL